MSCGWSVADDRVRTISDHAQSQFYSGICQLLSGIRHVISDPALYCQVLVVIAAVTPSGGGVTEGVSVQGPGGSGCPATTEHLHWEQFSRCTSVTGASKTGCEFGLWMGLEELTVTGLALPLGGA